ncbi:ly6/PLAUR domain-containing protein 6 [Menidia menidia]
MSGSSGLRRFSSSRKTRLEQLHEDRVSLKKEWEPRFLLSDAEMEKWPPVAWILLLTALIGRPRAARGRDFSMKDIVLLHPSTTPHPGAFKCFTCQDAPDNYDCNRWAPDQYCPPHARFCHTLHMMDAAGRSLSVSKRCAAPESCSLTGCSPLNAAGRQVCTSCCEGNICNVLVPRNSSSAVFSSRTPPLSNAPRLRTNAMMLLFLLFLLLLL